MYVIVENSSYKSALESQSLSSTKDFPKVYVWKVGIFPLKRQFDSPLEACQAVLDYIEGPWSDSGAKNLGITSANFSVLFADSPVHSTGYISLDKLSAAVPCQTIIDVENLTPSVPETFNPGYGAVLKDTYNDAKVQGGEVLVYCTGTVDSKRRMYDSPKGAIKGLKEYLKEDWDGIISDGNLTIHSFIIIKATKDVTHYTAFLNGDEVLLEVIPSTGNKEFTADDELF